MKSELLIIKNMLGDISLVEEDKRFIQMLIIDKCVTLLDYCDELIKLGKGSLTPPLLREVFEYSIILMGLGEIFSLNSFINHEDYRFVSNIRRELNLIVLKEFGKTKSNELKSYMDLIYRLLSNYTHANVDSLFHFILSKYSSENRKILIAEDMQLLYQMVQDFFLALAYKFLDIDEKVNTLKSEDVNKVIKKMFTKEDADNPLFIRMVSIPSVRAKYQMMMDEISEKFKKN